MTTTPTFKPIVKDRRFYNRFQYCIGFHLDEVSCLRELDHEYIDAILERRKQWREVSLQRWTHAKTSGKTILTRRWRDITDETASDLHTLADLLLTTAHDFKLVTSVSDAWVYTNNTELIEQVSQLPFIRRQQLSQAVVDRPANTIRLKNPRHNTRAYFRNIKITPQQKTQLCNFFANQADDIRTSPALVPWLANPFHRTQDYFFIDFTGEAWLVMLALIHPGLIRKTVSIIPAK